MKSRKLYEDFMREETLACLFCQDGKEFEKTMTNET